MSHYASVTQLDARGENDALGAAWQGIDNDTQEGTTTNIPAFTLSDIHAVYWQKLLHLDLIKVA